MKIVAIVVMWGALVAGLATAATAAAAEPAFFECAKVAHGEHGEFANKTCTEAAGGTTGKYELREGIGKKHGFALRSADISFSGSPEGENYECGITKGSGELTGPTSVDGVYLKLSHCGRCTSPGSLTGTIAIGPLSGTLGYVDRETHEVGVDLAREGGGPLAEFECGTGTPDTPTQQLTGSMIAVITGDVNGISKAAEMVVSKPGLEGGQEEVEQLEGGLPDVLGLRHLSTGEEEGVLVEEMSFKVTTGDLEIKA